MLNMKKQSYNTKSTLVQYGRV